MKLIQKLLNMNKVYFERTRQVFHGNLIQFIVLQSQLQLYKTQINSQDPQLKQSLKMISAEESVNQVGQLKKRTRKSKRISKQKSKNKQKLRNKQKGQIIYYPGEGRGQNFQKKKNQILPCDDGNFLTEEQEKKLKDFFDVKLDRLYNESISPLLKKQLQKILGISQIFNQKRHLLWERKMRLSESLIPHNKIVGYCNLITKWKQYTDESESGIRGCQSIALVQNRESRNMFLFESHQVNPQASEQVFVMQISAIQAEILLKRSIYEKRGSCTNLTYSVQDEGHGFNASPQSHEDGFDKSENIDQLDEQIEFLYDLYLEEENYLTSQYNRILKAGNYDLNFQKNQSNLSQEAVSQSDIFMTNLVYKTLKGAFEDEKIDRFNYHRDLELRQLKKGFQNYQPILTKQNLIEFLHRRKGKKGKALKFQLFTNCLACFSPFSEESNSFTACKQCHFRTHKICARFQQKCDRCNYKKLTQKKKQEVPECLVCGVQDLMFQRISSTKYIHQFCMLIHNLWKIDYEGNSDRRIIKFDCSSQELREKLDKNEIKQCCFCPEDSILKKSPVCFLKSCQICKRSFHAMCAYLRGGCKFNFQVQSCERRRADIKILCCSESKQERVRIASDRRFKANFQKIVFRSNGIGKEKKFDGLIQEESEFYYY